MFHYTLLDVKMKQNQHVTAAIGMPSAIQSSVPPTPAPLLLKVYVTDYLPRANLESFVKRYQKLIRLGAAKRSIRLEVVKGRDDPRNPWNIYQLHIFADCLVKSHPEIVTYLDMPSLAVIERCLRVLRNAGASDTTPSLLIYRISDRKGSEWLKLAQMFRFDPACTDNIDLGVTEPEFSKRKIYDHD